VAGRRRPSHKRYGVAPDPALSAPPGIRWTGIRPGQVAFSFCLLRPFVNHLVSTCRLFPLACRSAFLPFPPRHFCVGLGLGAATAAVVRRPLRRGRRGLFVPGPAVFERQASFLLSPGTLRSSMCPVREAAAPPRSPGQTCIRGWVSSRRCFETIFRLTRAASPSNKERAATTLGDASPTRRFSGGSMTWFGCLRRCVAFPLVSKARWFGAWLRTLAMSQWLTSLDFLLLWSGGGRLANPAPLANANRFPAPPRKPCFDAEMCLAACAFTSIL